MVKMDIKLYERIKELRKKHGFRSKRAFAEALNTNENNVKGWENAKKPVFPSLDKLVAMCELFDCDLDYLVGRREERTYDVKAIHDLTGLSAEAIEKILREKSTVGGTPVPGPSVHVLSRLIEADGFRDFVEAYLRFETATIMLGKSEIPQVKPYKVDEDGSIILDGSTQSSGSVIGINTSTLRNDDNARFYMWQLSQALMRLCEPDFKENYEMCMKNSKRNEGGMNNGQH